MRTEGFGAGAARQAGVEAATQRWIAFLDSDDLWPPDYLEHRVRLLQRGHEFICGPYDYVNRDGQIIESINLKNSFLSGWRLLKSNPIGNSSVTSNRRSLMQRGGYSRLYARSVMQLGQEYAGHTKISYYDYGDPKIHAIRWNSSLSTAKLKMVM